MADKSQEQFRDSDPRGLESYRKSRLSQLERLWTLKSEYAEDLNPIGMRLLDRAIESTFEDCNEAGVGERAREIMKKNIEGSS